MRWRPLVSTRTPARPFHCNTTVIIMVITKTTTIVPGPARGRAMESCVRSAGNSPASSPSLSRKVLGRSGKAINKPGHSSNVSFNPAERSVLDVSDIVVDSSILLPSSAPSNQGKESLKKCPCLYHNPKATYVVCTVCTQEWHNSCVNLDGLTPVAIKKLIKWKCPRCYVSPFSTRGQMDSVEELIIAELKSMIREVNIPPTSCSCTAMADSISNDLSYIKAKLQNSSSLEADNIQLSRTLEADNMQLSRTLEENNKLITAKIEKLHEDLLATPQTSSVGPSTENLEKLMESISEQLQVLSTHMDSAPLTKHLEESVDAPMSPNTESPHLHQSATISCEPFVCYEENVIGLELRDRLLQFAEQSPDDFIREGDCRDAQYYGEYGYWYAGKYHEPQETPLIIQELLDTVRPHLSNKSAWMNSCLITRYKSGSDHIPYHRDDEPHIDPESEILTVSIGSKRTVSFRDNSQSDMREREVADCSIYVMSRFSQDFWQHCIGQAECDVNDTRYSFTFRHISPHFRNYTTIVGDSNTKYLSFGRGIGSFGKWMPGRSIRASHVEHIPEPETIGPSSNVIIHTGINNLNTDDRRSNKFLINLLESKCKRILNVYPRTRIYISLLLPTKLSSLNNKIRDFNNLILDMTYGHKGMHVIDNSLLRDRYDCLGSDYGRFANRMPNTADPVHLGRRGIKIFSTNLKRSIMRKSSNQSTERFGAGGGNFGAAANRGHRDGFQEPW